MADGTLAGIISGTDPMAPVEMRALQAQQLGQSALDTSQWANQGIGGALGRMIAAARGNAAADQIAQIAQARVAAMPDLAAAYASGDPYRWAADNPGSSPLARAMLLNQPPEKVLATRTAAAQLPMVTARSQAATEALTGGGGVPGMVQSSTAAQPAQPAPARPAGGGQAAPPSSVGPAPVAAISGAIDNVQAALPAAGDQRIAYLQKLPPYLQRALLARITGGGAAGPTAGRVATAGAR